MRVCVPRKLWTALLISASGVFLLSATYMTPAQTSTSAPAPMPMPMPMPAQSATNAAAGSAGGAHGEWTWMGGANVGVQPPVYGTVGVAAPGNGPGSRVDSASASDAAGNFWLFGGEGTDSAGNSGMFNELWKYSAGQWTWVSGSNVGGQPGTYGTEGVAAPGNIPGAHDAAATWFDKDGNFWLFGGIGMDRTGANNYLNDLWKFSGGQWTWMGESDVNWDGLEGGKYGAKGVAAAKNAPGARAYSVGWTDAAGNFWLFGGWGYDAKGAQGSLSDLWKFSAGKWMWMSGSDLIGQAGTYGIEGKAAAANAPPPRRDAMGWTDAAGTLWMFGGDSPEFGVFDDMWKYRAGQWTWVSGSKKASQGECTGRGGLPPREIFRALETMLLPGPTRRGIFGCSAG